MLHETFDPNPRLIFNDPRLIANDRGHGTMTHETMPPHANTMRREKAAMAEALQAEVDARAPREVSKAQEIYFRIERLRRVHTDLRNLIEDVTGEETSECRDTTQPPPIPLSVLLDQGPQMLDNVIDDFNESIDTLRKLII